MTMNHPAQRAAHLIPPVLCPLIAVPLPATPPLPREPAEPQPSTASDALHCPSWSEDGLRAGGNARWPSC